MIKSLGEHFESYARLRPSEAPSCHARVLGLCLEAFVCTGYLGCQEGVLCIALQRLRLINILARSALPTRVFFPWRSIDFVSPTLLSMNLQFFHLYLPKKRRIWASLRERNLRSCKLLDAPVQADCKNSSKFAPERIAFAGLMLRYLRHDAHFICTGISAISA